MQKKRLKAKILKVLNKYPVGAVATIKSGKPWVRYSRLCGDQDHAYAYRVHEPRCNGAGGV